MLKLLENLPIVDIDIFSSELLVTSLTVEEEQRYTGNCGLREEETISNDNYVLLIIYNILIIFSDTYTCFYIA